MRVECVSGMTLCCPLRQAAARKTLQEAVEIATIEVLMCTAQLVFEELSRNCRVGGWPD